MFKVQHAHACNKIDIFHASMCLANACNGATNVVRLWAFFGIHAPRAPRWGAPINLALQLTVSQINGDCGDSELMLASLCRCC